MTTHFYTLLAAVLGSPDTLGFNGPKTDAGIMQRFLFTAYFWAGVICVLIVVIAGIFYIISQGDVSGVARAKNAILGAIIGLVVILFAFAITNFVIEAFK